MRLPLHPFARFAVLCSKPAMIIASIVCATLLCVVWVVSLSLSFTRCMYCRLSACNCVSFRFANALSPNTRSVPAVKLLGNALLRLFFHEHENRWVASSTPRKISPQHMNIHTNIHDRANSSHNICPNWFVRLTEFHVFVGLVFFRSQNVWNFN